ncbi:hypothetical protein PN36_31075 [Candidatus Thiomargarita nelsonii]|uniref:Uncharacterized protein n=1 Tax=Candidatus Thiomargarita nelsonii TaxID=1003181 RepID=A0A0A6P2T6_9GAMM|nr:hypothetical protein PN36_31075 [Candidatus Thiomargarita nelsonii]
MCLNSFSKRIVNKLLSVYPKWEKFVDITDDGLLEVCVPAPKASNAGVMCIFTTVDDDLWIRFSHPYMCYSLDDEEEMIYIVNALITDQALFIVIMNGDEWVSTTLIPSGTKPTIEKGQKVKVISWHGNLDILDCLT